MPRFVRLPPWVAPVAHRPCLYCLAEQALDTLQLGQGIGEIAISWGGGIADDSLAAVGSPLRGVAIDYLSVML